MVKHCNDFASNDRILFVHVLYIDVLDSYQYNVVYIYGKSTDLFLRILNC